MSDAETLAVYEARAGEYAARFRGSEDDRHLTAFIQRLPPGARVLDLGCGPGDAAARMARAGFVVEAWDAAQAMAALAARHAGVSARRARFDELDAAEAYDGIWANFSLLHAARRDLPVHLAAVVRALRPGGTFHIGMKTGAGGARDALGRAYTYYSVAELEALLSGAGLSVLARATGSDAGLAGPVEPWAVLLSEKPGA